MTRSRWRLSTLGFARTTSPGSSIASGRRVRNRRRSLSWRMPHRLGWTGSCEYGHRPARRRGSPRWLRVPRWVSSPRQRWWVGVHEAESMGSALSRRRRGADPGERWGGPFRLARARTWLRFTWNTVAVRLAHLAYARPPDACAPLRRPTRQPVAVGNSSCHEVASRCSGPRWHRAARRAHARTAFLLFHVERTRSVGV